MNGIRKREGGLIQMTKKNYLLKYPKRLYEKKKAQYQMMKDKKEREQSKDCLIKWGANMEFKEMEDKIENEIASIEGTYNDVSKEATKNIMKIIQDYILDKDVTPPSDSALETVLLQYKSTGDLGQIKDDINTLFGVY